MPTRGMNHLHARNIQNIHTVINHVPSSPRYNWRKIKGDNSCNIPSPNKCIIDMTCCFLKNATENIMKRFQFFSSSVQYVEYISTIFHIFIMMDKAEARQVWSEKAHCWSCRSERFDIILSSNAISCSSRQ